MSSFTWLDYSEHDRRRMQDVIQLFGEKETRDELGIGMVRDAFADLLFPGTSTIQTRARYFFFIPWIYLDLERQRLTAGEFQAKAREKETNLIDYLYNSGETQGLIGINARHNLKRLPSSIYWQGLAQWGIRHFPGPQDQYYRALADFYRANGQIQQYNAENEQQGSLYYNWHASLPKKPPGFPRQVTFALTSEEAEYLRERILRYAPQTLLAFLVDRSQLTKRTDFPWQHPQFGEFSKRIKEQLEHAQNFSEVIHGAALLYNLMLAEKACQVRSENWQEEVKSYQDRLHSWADKLAQPERQHSLNNWDWQSRFWEIVIGVNPRITSRTKNFINQWLSLAMAPGTANTMANNEQARNLLSHREHWLKGKLARLHNSRALELWSGEAGTGPLNYRWGNASATTGGVQTIVADILQGYHSVTIPEEPRA